MLNRLADIVATFKLVFTPLFLRCVLGVVLVLSMQQVNAQEHDETPSEGSEFTQQLWFDFDPSWSMGDGQKFVGNIGYRTIMPKSWHRIILKGSFEKNFDKLIFKKFKHNEKLLFGTALFFLTTEESEDYGSFEIRPFQGYQFAVNVSPRVVFKQLFRFEERFVFSNKPENQFFGMRFRYQVQAVFNLEGILFGEGEGFYIPVALEGFFNMVSTSQFNDIIRVTPGLGYQFNPDFKIEGSLAYHYTNEGISEVDKLTRTNDIVFRFRIIKTFK
ncbi:DUF2490 domain-containing protein [Formosa undariae]|uniref:DUF2490 domain-containing protein n=1 Tax=Formosa undariae TaxID=1325436 RepID=A0ABV5F211_9FLAO